MKRTLLFLSALLMAISGAWADGTWNLTSNDYTTDSWETMGENTPDGVTALGSYTACSRTEDITLNSDAVIEIRFTYTGGDHRLDMLGVDLLDGEDNVIASDYHEGYTGGQRDKNVYVLNNIPAGSYKLRYIIRNYATNSAGNISVFTLKCADSFANISQWYVVRAHSNQSHYMYYNSSNTATGISFTDNTTDINSDKYLWGFVKTDDGVAIYNKEAGSTVAIDNATPSTMSAGGTSVGFAFTYPTSNGTQELGADAFFAIYQTAGTYLNYQNENLQRWTTADAGSTFMLYEANEAETLSYTLTDANEATYSGTYSGVAGWTEPPLTGCAGYSLSNKVWDGTTFTATINFPFAISSNGVDNWTYINSFDHKSGYSISDGSCFYWHANDNGEDVNVRDGDVPTNIKENKVYTDNEKYKWAVYPAISNLNITFTIKNSYTGKYIFSNTNDKSHDKGAVTLSETGTPLTYDTSTTTGCGTIYTWYIPSTKLYLSVNSATETDIAKALLGVYDQKHDGLSIGFYTPADFATLDASLLAACLNYDTFKTDRKFGTNLGEYNGSSYKSMEAAYLAATTASSLTAAQLSAHTSTLENPATKLTLNLPATNNFYRFKIGEKYMCSIAESDNVRTATSTSDDATTVFYLDNNSYLIGYADGYGFNYGYCKATAPGIFNLFEFSESSQVGTYNIHTTAGTGDTQWSDRKITINDNKLAKGQGTWTIEEVTELPVTITSAGYATLYAPVALTIPTGVTAYKATDEGEYLTLTAIEGGVIPANTGVILKGDERTYNFDITTGGSAESNALRGTVAAITRPDGSYILSTSTENGVGFYKDGAQTIPGFKSYLPAEATEGIRGFLGFNFDDPTAISVIEAAMNAGKTIYDLSGRRVENPTNGLYIVNGKKVFINKK